MGIKERKRQKKLKEYVIDRDGLLCCYCDKVLLPETATLDHIVPDSKGGMFNATNLTIACAKCNSERGNQSFFNYCLNFNWDQDKINKYKMLYFSNLKIKILNIAKEKFLTEQAVPNIIINKACKFLKIKNISFKNYEEYFTLNIKFEDLCSHREIKYCFEELIRLIEAESREYS